MPDSLDPPPRGSSPSDLVAWLIGPVLLVLAAGFVFLDKPVRIPIEGSATVPVSEILSPPRDVMLEDPPTMIVAGFTKKCTECHELFTSPPDTPLRLNQHRNIVQAHGMNDRCFNCHDNDDRGRLMLPGGETLPFAEAPRLCATCHGPTYRDWQLGMHGRTTGSWDEGSPNQLRLSCTQCHDPHAPAFAPMLALPGPNTLRMGPQSAEGPGAPGKRNPLRQWSGGNHAGEGAH